MSTHFPVDMCQVVVVKLFASSLKGRQLSTVHLAVEFPSDRLRDTLRPLLVEYLFLAELQHLIVTQERLQTILTTISGQFK